MLKKLIILIVYLCSFIVTTVHAEGTSIILDAADKTTQFSASAYVVASIAFVIVAAFIIIKILLSRRGD